MNDNSYETDNFLYFNNKIRNRYKYLLNEEEFNKYAKVPYNCNKIIKYRMLSSKSEKHIISKLTDEVKYSAISYTLNSLISDRHYGGEIKSGEEYAQMLLYKYYIMALSIMLDNDHFYQMRKIDTLDWNNLSTFESVEVNGQTIENINNPLKIYYSKEKYMNKVMNYLNKKEVVPMKKIRKGRVTQEQLEEIRRNKLSASNQRNLINIIFEEYLKAQVGSEEYERLAKYLKEGGAHLKQSDLVKYVRNAGAHLSAYIRNDAFILRPKTLDGKDLELVLYPDNMADIIKEYLINIKPMLGDPKVDDRYKELLYISWEMKQMMDYLNTYKKHFGTKIRSNLTRAFKILDDIVKSNDIRFIYDDIDYSKKTDMRVLLNLLFVQTDYSNVDINGMYFNNMSITNGNIKKDESTVIAINNSLNELKRSSDKLAEVTKAYQEAKISEEKFDAIKPNIISKLDNIRNRFKNQCVDLNAINKYSNAEIMRGVRDALAHGDYDITKENDEYMISLRDKVPQTGNTTFECKVPFLDLIGGVLNSNILSVIYNKHNPTIPGDPTGGYQP